MYKLQLYAVLKQVMNPIFIDQLSYLHLLKSMYYASIKIFYNLPCRLISLINDKAQFKAALKWYVNMHYFYSVDEFIIFKSGS